jgi:hypothetical protein
MATGMLATAAAAPSWSGPRLTTTPMRAADAAAIVNETGSFMSALGVGLQVFLDLQGLLGR